MCVLCCRWTIPPYKCKLEDLDCREIQLCIKEYHSMQLLRRPSDRFGIEYETVQECNANSRNEPRLFVVDVIHSSIAEIGGTSNSGLAQLDDRSANRLINWKTTLVEKKCVPCKDLARFSFKVLQDNAFFCKTSCKNLARKNISLQDSSKEKNFVEGSRQFFLFFIFIVFDFKLTTAS